MLLEASEQNQLTVILTLATILFIVASALPQNVAGTILLLLVPFQSVQTRFGTSSVVLAFIVFIALILRKKPVRLPMLPHFLFLLLWYLVTMSLMNVSSYSQHGIYIFTFISAILVFWICYDLMYRVANPRQIIGIFIIMNALVAVYCAIQLWIGPGERLVLFGISEMNMTRVRADGRLTGPFESAEITAQYLVMMQFLILHQYWHTTKTINRRLLVVLALLNLGFLVATGSRGEFLLLIGGMAVYLWLFRKQLGPRRSLAIAGSAAVALSIVALLVVNLTQFGGLFDRLAGTEFTEEGIPDTRQYLWPPVWNEIVKKPIVGHGPRFRYYHEERGVRYENHTFLKYPHNLYLFLLFTVGVPGLLLFMFVILTVGYRCWKSMSKPNAPPYLSDLARTGVIIIMLFVIDGAKIEQMRLGLSDFWHFFFGLCGVLVGACALVDRRAKQECMPADS